MVASPTARTLERCRKWQWRAGVVERWIPQMRRRADLFGCIDLVALDSSDGVLGIQATSTGNMSSRLHKATTDCRDDLTRWLERNNRFEIWGWAKRGPRGKRKLWTLRRVEVYLAWDPSPTLCHRELDNDPS
tara:strand:- start:13990 stop:14385 length:396 start_codon:yes stop_codon:yes gene_type:complete